MKIRKCGINDIDKTVEFYDKVTLYVEKHDNLPKWKYKVYPNREHVENMVKTNAQYICLSNKAIIGAFALDMTPRGNYDKVTWSKEIPTGMYTCLHTLATSPAYYHKGVGRLLVQKAIQLSKTSGAKAIRLDIVPDNTPAKRLYESLGFQYVANSTLDRDIEGINTFELYELIL